VVMMREEARKRTERPESSRDTYTRRAGKAKLNGSVTRMGARMDGTLQPRTAMVQITKVPKVHRQTSLLRPMTSLGL